MCCQLSLSLNDIIVLSDGNPQHTETLYTDFCNYCCYHTLPFFNILTRHSSLQMRRKEDLHVHMVGACLVLILRFLMWRTLWLVMYDATGVRLQAGRQAEVLNQIVYELPTAHPLAESRPLHELLGHTPLQVIAGSLLGLVIATFVHLIGGLWSSLIFR